VKFPFAKILKSEIFKKGMFPNDGVAELIEGQMRQCVCTDYFIRLIRSRVVVSDSNYVRTKCDLCQTSRVHLLFAEEI
jgi:hypothetical protein